MFTINVVVPSPSVTVTAPNNQTVGQPLTLTCNAATVRGVTSRVDIVWSRGDNRLNRSNRITPTTMNSLLLYTDTYTILPLSTDDDDREYECSVVIHTSPLTMFNNSVLLDVAGTSV